MAIDWSALIFFSLVIACIVLLISLGWKLVKRFLKIWLVVVVLLLILKFGLGVPII